MSCQGVAIMSVTDQFEFIPFTSTKHLSLLPYPIQLPTPHGNFSSDLTHCLHSSSPMPSCVDLHSAPNKGKGRRTIRPPLFRILSVSSLANSNFFSRFTSFLPLLHPQCRCDRCTGTSLCIHSLFNLIRSSTYIIWGKQFWNRIVSLLSLS